MNEQAGGQPDITPTAEIDGVNAMARIVSASVFEIEAAFVKPYKLAVGTMVSTRAVMVKLVDADGTIGWGEANPHLTFTGESSSDVMAALKDFLLPALLAATVPNPARIDRLFDELMPRQFCAKGAISMALLDILGRRLRVPVYTLLGGALRSWLTVLWPLSNGTSEEDRRVIDEKAAVGFSTFMIKMGTSPIADEVKRVAELEALYGERITFIADANQGWTFSEARDFLKGVAGSRLAFVEQPVNKEDISALATLARETNLPLSVDESLVSLASAGQIAALGAAKVFSIKSSKNGGPLRAQRIAAVAEAFGIKCYMNSMLEFGITQAASLQHAATIANLAEAGHAFMSTLRLAEDPTDFSSNIRDGVVHIGARAGLGVDVDEQHVQRLSRGEFRLGS